MHELRTCETLLRPLTTCACVKLQIALVTSQGERSSGEPLEFLGEPRNFRSKMRNDPAHAARRKAMNVRPGVNVADQEILCRED